MNNNHNNNIFSFKKFSAFSEETEMLAGLASGDDGTQFAPSEQNPSFSHVPANQDYFVPQFAEAHNSE